jgi:hypothetical protein
MTSPSRKREKEHVFQLLMGRTFKAIKKTIALLEKK